MTVSSLPNLYLQWEESTVDIAEFQRYQIYRRVSGETTWVKIKKINDRTITYYNDYTVASGVTYEYTVTQVKDIAGEELESEYPSAVSSSVNIKNVFIHDVANPEHYVELGPIAQTVNVEQEVMFLRPWGRQQPTAHIGSGQHHTIEVSFKDLWSTGSDAWEGLENLLTRQRTAGAVLMVRQERSVRYFCNLEQNPRDDTHGLYSQTVRLREVYFREQVD